MSQQGLSRPSQVTVAGGLGVAGALIFVLALFDAMSATRTVGAQNAVAEMLASPPYDGLGVTVDEMLGFIRVALMVMGAVAAVAFVFAFYLFRRHNGARIGFTVSAVVLFPGLLGTMGLGFATIMISIAAIGLWSEPARDWFAGRPPRSKPAHREPRHQARASVPVSSQDQPPPSPYPFGAPMPPGAPQGPAAGPAAPPYAPVPSDWPAHQGAYPPPGVPDADKRPGSVVWAVVLTWVFASLTTGLMAVVLVLLAGSQAKFEERVQREIDGDATLRDLGVTADQLMTYVWATCIVLLLWSVAAVVIAVFAYRRANWARILLAVSALGAAVVSLLGILTVVAIGTLIPAVVVVFLLFGRSASAWYGRRPQHPTAPYSPPPGRNQPW